ncbi:hypothetical protein [Pseudoblastomonas halimionae]|uniref:SH3 domain-containing protein n=1 Tax=Alteriqipengyuania halimionae TaxID=1926630 RepID=A0A6I4U1L1_9SPHN|nr:hypothetical protein [Alteriqipengyuania halimionae]MXP09596.1 hypothetical protein [Alteriqipengyuania halimionae]
MNRYIWTSFAMLLATSPSIAQEAATSENGLPIEAPAIEDGTLRSTDDAPTVEERIATDTPDLACEFFGSWEAVGAGGSTMMVVRQTKPNFDDGDSLLVAFQNPSWSISIGDQLGVIRVTNDDGGWFENAAHSINNGFAISSNFEHVSNVFDGMPSAIIVTRGETIIDSLRALSLYRRWEDFKQCRRSWVDDRDERDRLRELEQNIPVDPFAN